MEELWDVNVVALGVIWPNYFGVGFGVGLLPKNRLFIGGIRSTIELRPRFVTVTGDPGAVSGAGFWNLRRLGTFPCALNRCRL